MEIETPAPGARQTILLIGGMPRSGTTLLSNLIQSRWNVPVAPETHFFDMAMWNGVAGLPEVLRQDARIVAAYRDLPVPAPADPVRTFRCLVGRLVPTSLPLVGEKTPDHLMYFRRILREDPDTRAIVIVRDCAEVCNSLARMNWNDRDTLRNLKLWAKYYLETARLRRSFPGRVAVVGYEALSQAVDVHLARLAAELGLSPNVETVSAGANYDAVAEPWKDGADGPVRRAAATGTPELDLHQRLLAIAADRVLRLLLRIPGLR